MGRDVPVDSTVPVVDSATTVDMPTRRDDAGTDVPGADVPGADVPGADVPGADVPSADVVAVDVHDAGVTSDVVVADGGVGPSVRFVGQEDSVTEFRTSGVTRLFDLDGDGAYGTAGYVFYAVRTGGPVDAGVFIDSDPLAFAVDGFETLSSIPRYLQMASNGMGTVSAGHGYPLIDDPRRGPVSSVDDRESGLGLHNNVTIGTEATLLDLTVRSGAPPTIRVGVMALGRGQDAMIRVRLTGAAGVGAEATRVGSPTTFFHFFDIVGAREGDRFTVSMTKDSMGGSNPNVAHLGVVFDG